MQLKSINPANEKLISEYNEYKTEQITDIIEKAHSEFPHWKKMVSHKKTHLMNKIAFLLRKDKMKYAELMTAEMGKPIQSSINEIEKCAWVCEYYAENAEKFLQDRVIETDGSKSFITYQPLGVILAVMPWNFPFWQVFRFAAPSLMAGNVAILKHASNVSGCALAIEHIFKGAGFPENTFRTLLVSSKNVKQIIENRKIKAVTLTGSSSAGKHIAKTAGANIKKTVLELGGNDAYVVLKDANLRLAAKKCVQSRMINNGQSCIAAKRFIVDKVVKQKFENLVVEKMQKIKMGNPANKAYSLGPLARKDLRDTLHKQVQTSIQNGATCLLGGDIPPETGYYYPPTVLTDVPEDSPAYKEELFGPVAAIITADNEKEAIRIANDSDFGLGAAIFTNDRHKGELIATEKLEAGCCFVNDFVRSDPRLPFGGIKQSGYGRELSVEGIREFVNIKTIYLP